MNADVEVLEFGGHLSDEIALELANIDVLFPAVFDDHKC